MSNEKILLLEDNPVETLGLTRVLQQNGYTVTPATDAIEAMRALRSEKPDLLLLDVNLPVNVPFDSPKWDGLDFMEWMHTMTDFYIPVIVQTSTSLVEIQRRPGDARAVAYFQKPANMQDLMAAIRSALETARAAAPLSVPTQPCQNVAPQGLRPDAEVTIEYYGDNETTSDRLERGRD